MTRFFSYFAALALVLVVFTASAHAQSAVQIAAKENEAGKALMFEGRYKEASEKFRSAANRSPDPKYFFNVCASEYQQNALRQAMAACKAADKLAPDSVLKTKLAKLEARIKSDADAQGIDLSPAEAGPAGGPAPDGSGGSGSSGGGGAIPGGGPTPGSGPTSGPAGGPTPGGGPTAGPAGGPTPGGGPTAGPAGGPTPGGGPTSGPAGGPTPGGTTSAGPGGARGGMPPQPQQQDLFVEAKPEHVYTWTVGVDLFGGRGSVGANQPFGDVAAGIRLRTDYLIKPKAKFGSQFYVQGTGFASGNKSLQLFDTGAGFYKHFCGSTRLCITPLAAAHITLMNPSNDSTSTSSQVFNYVGVGARLEGTLSYALGSRLEHVISAGIDANFYTRVLSEPMNSVSARSWGLDQGGRVVSLTLGYTYRFNTPTAHVPFLSLE